ncbi:DUF6261 family protein [Petrimonas sp.]|uniref:DUF6261 family protein n=1 Tax=Petrimonas sp. TaxID=2023866 RepID=UPI003F511F40
MKLNLRRLSTRSLAYGAKLFINVTNNNEQEAVKITPPFTLLVSEYTAYAPLVPRVSNKELKEKAAKAAEKVLTDIKNIKKFATGFAAMYPDTDKGLAATAILKAIAKGGKLYKGAAGELDSGITTVVRELKSPEMAQQIAAMEVTGHVATLVEDKAAYDAANVQRINAESDLAQTDSASTARPKLESAIRDYLALVTAMRKADGWQDLYADLNEVVKVLKRSIRENKEAEELPPPADATE